MATTSAHKEHRLGSSRIALPKKTERPVACHRSLIFLAASALEGDRTALLRMADDPGIPPFADYHRIGPLLARQAERMPVEGRNSNHWANSLRWYTARHLALRRTLEEVGKVLTDAGLLWMPLKGLATAPLLYEQSAHRPTNDVDVLVSGADFDPAIAALRCAGWLPRDDRPVFHDFVRQEGYNVPLTGPLAGVVELHFRFWGLCPNEFAEHVLHRAIRGIDAQLAGPLESDLADMYLICASHLCQGARPVPLIYLWELHQILRTQESQLTARIIARAQEEDIALLVGLASKMVGGVFSDEKARLVWKTLHETLRFLEKRVSSRARLRRDGTFVSLETIVLVRLLSARSSRQGWRSVFRRVWPHPAFVQNNNKSALRVLLNRGKWLAGSLRKLWSIRFRR